MEEKRDAREVIEESKLCPEVQQHLQALQQEVESQKRAEAQILGEIEVSKDKLNRLRQGMAANTASIRVVQESIAAYRQHLLNEIDPKEAPEK